MMATSDSMVAAAAKTRVRSSQFSVNHETFLACLDRVLFWVYIQNKKAVYGRGRYRIRNSKGFKEMYRNDMCGAYCAPMGFGSKKDQVALLEEQEKILEAKLATIKHMKESVKNSKDEDDKE